jgi:glycosyltransferase involved in cell wall biosynthesis
MRAQLRLPQAALCIGVVGQITPWKGQLDAIRALALLRDRFPAAHLLLVGEVKFARRSTRYDNVAYAAELRSEIGRQDLWDRVQLLGERSDLPDVMSAMDVLLVPSWEEPFGRVVIEAMALGVAVIATSVGGTVEIITDGVDGLLLGPREPEAWAAALARLIESAELRSRIGEAAATRAADFDLGIHLAAMRGVFDDAHRNQSGGARRRTASSRLGAG